MEESKLHKEYPTAYHPNDKAAEELKKFAEVFQQSAQKWEKVVYPALLAFSILAAYGFYLVFSLTTDMRIIAEDIHVITASFGDDEKGHMSTLARGVDRMTGDMKALRITIDNMRTDINTMNGNMNKMTASIDNINGNMGTMTTQLATLQPMLERINNMDYSTQTMANSMVYMGDQIGDMNNDMNPSGMFSRFMPF
jgi:methyl-accepting chemotaxis protein